MRSRRISVAPSASAESIEPPFPIGADQNRETCNNSYTAINRPPNLTGHETARQHIDSLQESDGAEYHQQNPHDVQAYPHVVSAHVAVKIISGELSAKGERSNAPYSAVTSKPERASRCSSSNRKK
jgi:hypothetical protein